MAGLTTHVLDLTHGTPADHVEIDLYTIKGKNKEHIKTDTTNLDGRLDAPLLTELEIQQGEYEIVFHIGSYFKRKGVELEEPNFLQTVPVRFGISEPDSHYHVPLLVSPWGYHVYRGS
ncbi:hydroxyisourate hydrolase [Halobacillus sp. A1]|uniref:hydroxyisourate hydrolase n=1 Tax=Halobacillus sp. A1 TaxID=2880262 RepID=UPI0020A6B0B2|nr:hydroxyisourate hydrolase [Halobacillus sp. A1]MCP3029926.1 hydroxyisourate hydrolase [Halobacillus sp. A1]